LTSINVKSMYEAPCAFHAQMPAHFTEQHDYILDSLMAWPSDDQRARQYCRRRLVDQYAALQDAAERVPMITVIPGFIEAKRLCWEFLDGWSGILNLPAKDDLDRDHHSLRTRGHQVGATFCILYWCQASHATQLAQPISLNRVWKWIEQYGSLWIPLYTTKDRLDEDWEQFKPVAHLWAADFAFHWLGFAKQTHAYFASQWQNEIVPMLPHGALEERPEEVDRALAIVKNVDDINHRLRYLFTFARHFQEFGLSFTSKRSRKPLLDRDRLLLLEDVPDWGIPFPEVELPDEWIESMNTII